MKHPRMITVFGIPEAFWPASPPAHAGHASRVIGKRKKAKVAKVLIIKGR
jgi:hypothetical protein